ncbi:SufD family Fe-S cluster assembly protein [Desulfovibrio sp. OttesenSCG-928-M14]|nr:SufD family Fe-S cluster assembly protein [Desulfovibrio sp. OttesenSCG-928-M14]
MNNVVKELFHKVADIQGAPAGAFNLRVNGRSIGRENSANVSIVPKKDGQGFDMYIKPGARDEKIHIPVVLDGDGITDVVSNDFHVGEGCDIVIVAGCGIHNSGCGQSRHDGIHSFYLGKNSRVVYKEIHLGQGNAEAQRVLNPVTNIHLDEGAHFEMESVQLEGVDSTHRVTRGELGTESHLTVTEKLLTDGSQWAKTEFDLDINGPGAKARLVSRSVAKGRSYQEFLSKITGNADCTGHSECDAIIMDSAVVKAIPEITAAHVDASLIHEAAIGKIAGEQLVKLMTLGLDAEEAEAHIINGFLS